MNKRFFVLWLLLGPLSVWVCVANPAPQSEASAFSNVSIVGVDDRQEITGRAFGMEKAVVVLEMTTPDGRTGLCSGSMVGPRIVLTAAHCLHMDGKYQKKVTVFAVGLPAEQSGGQVQENQPPKRNVPNVVQPPRPNDSARLENPGLPNAPVKRKKQGQEPGVRTPGKSSKGASGFAEILQRKINERVAQGYKPTAAESDAALDSERGGIEDAVERFFRGLRSEGVPFAAATKVWVPRQWINPPQVKRGEDEFLETEKYDYGILILDKPLGDRTGYFELHTQSTYELQNSKIVVIGRGGDKPKRTLWKSEGRVGKVYDRYFFHNADMVRGNSGGPILDTRDTSKIIALNNFQFGKDRQREGAFPNGGLRITQDIIDVVHKYGQ